MIILNKYVSRSVLVQEDFDGLNYSMAQILAHVALSVLATTLNDSTATPTTMTATLNNGTAIIAIAVVVAIVVAVLLVIVALVSFILFRRLRYIQ